MEIEREMYQFVIRRRKILAEPFVLAQQEAVVGVDNEDRILPHIVRIHEVQNQPEVHIAHCHQSRILSSCILQIFTVVFAGNSAVSGPVQSFFFRQIVQGTVFLRNIEGLVRIKALYL